jgi:signal transduction histidine kinase
MVAAVLLVLLATLATLQYRWLGEVSNAERDRMRAGLRTRTSEFTQEFDAQLTRAYVAFYVDGDRIESDPASALAGAHTRWRASASVPDLVKAIYLIEGTRFDAAHVRRLDPERRQLDPIPWPPDVLASLTRSHQFLPRVRGAGGPGTLLLADAVDSRIPALIVAVPFIKRLGSDQELTVKADTALPVRVIVVTLDAERLQRQILEPLVTKYFGERGVSEYVVTVVRRDEPQTVVYSSSDGAPVDAAAADVTSGLFDLRMDELNRLAVAPGAAAHPMLGEQRLAITIVRRANGPDGRRVLMAGGDQQGAWQVRVAHRDGSLDAIVAKSRRRNLAISLGVLGLLAASVVLVIAAAQRQQRLAQQQMEFVAAVSHELRTPLAVICSAGENLADGLIGDGTQVKRYGALIQSEGRRLRDMVERVLAFAGVTSDAPPRPYADVDVARVIADAVSGLKSDAQSRGVAIDVHVNGSRHAVHGDADALRSAVENVIGNAVKYSADGGRVDVTTEVRGSGVEIRVADRGLGIDADDLPHIFKPFHRGRRAVEAQVRGTGVGLSVVRHVVDAHHGDVRVESTPGEGTLVVIDLPRSDLTTTDATKVSDASDTSDTV